MRTNLDKRRRHGDGRTHDLERRARHKGGRAEGRGRRDEGEDEAKHMRL